MLIHIIVTATFMSIAAIAYGSQCRCSPQNSLAMTCANKISDVLTSHEHAELYGDCLTNLDVPANTMKCFRWGTKQCLDSDTEMKCKLYPQTDSSGPLVDMESNGRVRLLQSPGYARVHRGAKNRHVCVYNVSLNCTGHSTDLYTTERYSRSNDPNSEVKKCADYVKFYTNSTGQNDITVCGEEFGDFRATLNSHSFLAIMWTDKKKSQGKFQMLASCGSAVVPSIPETEDRDIIEAC